MTNYGPYYKSAWNWRPHHFQAMGHHYALHPSAPPHSSKRVLSISSVAEFTAPCMTSSSHPQFDVISLLSTFVLSSSRFSQVGNLFTHRSWFTDFISRRFPSEDTVWTWWILNTSATFRHLPLSSNRILRRETCYWWIWTPRNGRINTRDSLRNITSSAFWLHLWATLHDVLCYTTVTLDHATKHVSRRFREIYGFAENIRIGLRQQQSCKPEQSWQTLRSHPMWILVAHWFEPSRGS